MFHNISVKDALKLAYLKKAVLIDIRDFKDYKMGHLPTALWMKEQEMEVFMDTNKEILPILYCEFGNASLSLARDLSKKGYEVYSIVGGYRAYEGYVELQKGDIWTMEWKSI